MARTGAGLGTAPAIVNFEQIDKASSEHPRPPKASNAPCARPERAVPHAGQAYDDRGSDPLRVDEVGARAVILGTRDLTGIKSLRRADECDDASSAPIGTVQFPVPPHDALR
jgi:hypothetical protein